MAMSNQEKLELVITARNLTQAEFDKLANSLKTTTTQANAAQASMGKFAKVREPLMRLASGPLQQLMGSFGAFIRLAATLPKAVLGPIGILIGLIMALESKFNIIAKTIATVKVAFEALASFNFDGLGKQISDIWTGAKEKAEAAAKAAKDYNAAYIEMLDAQGKEGESTVRKEIARHELRLEEIKNKYKEGTDEYQRLMWVENDTHTAVINSMMKETEKKFETEKQQHEEAVRYSQQLNGQRLIDQAKEEQAWIDEQEKYEEESRARSIEKRRAERNREKEEIKAFWQEINGYIGGVVDNVASTFGAAFEQMVNTSKTAGEAMIEAFNQFGRQILFWLGKMIAKFLFLNFLKAVFSGATGGIGGAIAGFAETSLGKMAAGFDALLPSKQADTGAVSRVPGAFGMPVPIIAHGGELIGRPDGGGGPSIVIQGDVYGWDETIERIRSGLYTHSRRTGMSAVPA